MCLQSFHCVVITDRAVLAPMLFLWLIKVDMKLYKHLNCLVGVFISSVTSKHVAGAYEIILPQSLIMRSKKANYWICVALCDTVYAQGSFTRELALTNNTHLF